MASSTIKTPSGATITLSSEGLSQADLVLAEVLLEMAVEQGSTTVEASSDEIIRRPGGQGLSTRRRSYPLGIAAHQ